MFQVRRIGFALGAEVSECDLRAPLDEEAQDALRQALIEHQVLVFHGQRLEPEQLVRFAALFGPLADMRDETEILEGHPSVIRLSNELGSRTRIYGSSWHTDGLDFLPVPDGVTLLNCLECPSVGGETLFASQYLAYETLTLAYRQMLQGLRWHVPLILRLAHPAVRIHEKTGRPFLYLPSATEPTWFCGMSMTESKPILRFINRHRCDDRFVYRHRWCKDDLVVWENCATIHKVASDTDRREPRVMNRTRTRGTLLPTEVDSSSGDPVERSFAPEDAVAVMRPTSFTRRTNARGEAEGVISFLDTQDPELVLPATTQSAWTLIAGILEAEKFIARDALRWCEPGVEWPEARDVLELLRAKAVLARDRFGGSRLSPPTPDQIE